MNITSASVKVMRSYDYCHFEINLGVAHDSSGNPVSLNPADVDELRKTAARLADKAVDQYKVAKENSAKILNDRSLREYEARAVEEIEKRPEGDRTVNEIARVKAFRDRAYHERKYDYEDQWEPADS